MSSYGTKRAPTEDNRTCLDLGATCMYDDLHNKGSRPERCRGRWAQKKSTPRPRLKSVNTNNNLAAAGIGLHQFMRLCNLLEVKYRHRLRLVNPLANLVYDGL